MAEVLQANIFFMIASFGVIVLTTLVCILLYQLIKIVRSVRRIVEKVEEGSEVIMDDIDNIREAFNPARLITFVMGMMPGAKPKRSRRTRSDN